jgi:NAD(P)-dependent dehydrogenase (short-subunit alcohol dehydrogenase family)
VARQERIADHEWAVVLGASSGFGGAVALELARAGCHVAGVHLDRRATLANADRIVSQIKAAGREALFFNVNAADPAKRQEVLDALQARCQSASGTSAVKVLFHSLAFGTLKPFIGASIDEEIAQPQVEMTVDVMANSLVYWTQDLARRRLLREGSRIYAMTSSGGTRVWPTYGAVSAAKAALESHIRQLALELAPLGVTANAIRAGVTDTPALRKIPGCEEMIGMATKRNPFRRLTTPQDVADAVSVLMHTKTQWITGNVIGVDGGEDIVG